MIDPAAFVRPTAILIGNVIIGPRCYVGSAASLRGDFGRIILEEGTNVQDTRVVHGCPHADTVVEAKATSATAPCCRATWSSATH